MRSIKSSKGGKKGFGGYPAASIAYYGPDDVTASKVVVGILDGEGEVQDVRRWYTADGDVRSDQRITSEIIEFIKSHGVSNTRGVDRIMGCPHEEGLDYPEGEDCGKCPFWVNYRQAADETEH